VSNEDMLNTIDLVIVPSFDSTQGFINCQYQEFMDLYYKKFVDRGSEIKIFKLLCLAIDCFSFYLNEILLPYLKKKYPANDQIRQLYSWPNKNCLSREELISAVVATGITEDDYDALHDLRQRRNRSCHSCLISRAKTKLLEKEAQEFKTLQMKIDGELNYSKAVQILSKVLQELPDESFHPEKDFILSNKLI